MMGQVMELVVVDGPPTQPNDDFYILTNTNPNPNSNSNLRISFVYILVDLYDDEVTQMLCDKYIVDSKKYSLEWL